MREFKQITIYKNNRSPDFNIDELKEALLTGWKIETVICQGNNTVILSK